MPYAARLLITEVDQSPAGSVTFPEIDPDDWHETEPRAARRLRLGDLRAATAEVHGVPSENSPSSL